jgi:ubiquinone/menaquinone biosynthesis C-methylase UbiE
MTPHLLEEARARAASEGLNIRFDEVFAEALPYPDASFDMVVSMFGIMFSPVPETVVSEMARVLRPGGRLALANWTPPRRAETGRSLAGLGATLDRQQSCRRRPEPYPDPQRVFGNTRHTALRPHLRPLAFAANDGLPQGRSA